MLVADEVHCGMGRTGKWFAYQHWPAAEPDIVCVSKALSGGYVPVGAVISSPRIMDSVFDSMERSVVHSNTFGQNDLAMAAALATMRVMEEECVPENAAQIGAEAIARLAEIGATCPFVSGVKGRGMMFGIDFQRPAGSLKLKAAWDALHLLHEGVFSQTVIMPLLDEHRILTQVAGYGTELIKFLPPLIIGREELDYFLSAMRKVLDGLQRPANTLSAVRALAKGATAQLASRGA